MEFWRGTAPHRPTRTIARLPLLGRVGQITRGYNYNNTGKVRLQDELGTPLFRKRGRGLALTEAGEVALTYARRILALHDELLETMQGANVTGHIRVGCTMDFALILPPVLSHFASLYPQIQVELRIEGNAALADAVEKAQIDLAVVIGHAECAALIVARLFLRGVTTYEPNCDHRRRRVRASRVAAD